MEAIDVADVELDEAPKRPDDEEDPEWLLVPPTTVIAELLIAAAELEGEVDEEVEEAEEEGDGVEVTLAVVALLLLPAAVGMLGEDVE
ncbi:hypothetical protein BGW41_000559 [Actinomortierella wolfii]|nr:hypothetical protein BGW41_000559 [Actinomortierella wolfii]